MRQAGIQGAKRHGKSLRTTTPDLTAARRPDLVERDFSASRPNRLWVGYVTYLRSWEGVSYFSFGIDAFSRKVVGWQLASHMRTDLVLDALRMALGSEARRIAEEMGWSRTYDAEYAALATLLGRRLVTLDIRLRRGADRLGMAITPSEL